MQKFLNNKLSHKWLASKDSYFKEQGSKALALLAGEKDKCALIKNYHP